MLGHLKNSFVLEQMGADLESSSPIRCSLSKYTTKEEIDIFVQDLIYLVNKLREDN